MFYLKYRPKKISELDNSNVKNQLMKILSSSDFPHAYLFVGQKGTGKTSSARIFAKAINCLNNDFAKNTKVKNNFEPCNICENCLAIDNGSFNDVIELDAASNRGVEEIKNLIKETSFSPMSGNYRVFIIDEAHMITNEGFNALLKTLEEPPSTAIFILATTNLEKVPKTIVSRCLKVNFGKAVDIVVSRGSVDLVKVPFLEGLNLDNAIKLLNESELQVGNVVYVENQTYLPNTVLNQGIKAGVLVKKGSPIDLTVVK
jgi:DNA polymerase-3 subunit gamma/tau